MRSMAPKCVRAPASIRSWPHFQHQAASLGKCVVRENAFVPFLGIEPGALYVHILIRIVPAYYLKLPAGVVIGIQADAYAVENRGAYLVIGIHPAAAVLLKQAYCHQYAQGSHLPLVFIVAIASIGSDVAIGRLDLPDPLLSEVGGTCI